jgi:histidyl-tRNA synthetase
VLHAPQVIIGEDEMAKGEIVIKDMRSGTQVSVPAGSDIAAHLATMLCDPPGS